MSAIIQNLLYAISRITNPAPAGSSAPTLPATQDGITAYVDFKAYAASNPSYQEARVFVNKDNKDLELYKSLSTTNGVNVTLVPHIIKVCQPEAVIPMAFGSPVRLAGFDTTLGLPKVSSVNVFTQDAASICHGILLNDIYTYGEGESQVTGYIATAGIVTCAYVGEDPITAGARLYVSSFGDSVSNVPASIEIPVGVAVEDVEAYAPSVHMLIRF